MIKPITYLSLLTCGLSLISCNNVPEKVAAEEICNCAEQVEQKLSPNFVDLVIECLNNENFSSCFSNKLNNLDSTQAHIFLTHDLPVILNLDAKDNEFRKCIEGFEKKYENKYSFDKEETIREVMVEMEKNDCRFGLSLLKQGLKDSIQ